MLSDLLEAWNRAESWGYNRAHIMSSPATTTRTRRRSRAIMHPFFHLMSETSDGTRAERAAVAGLPMSMSIGSSIKLKDRCLFIAVPTSSNA